VQINLPGTGMLQDSKWQRHFGSALLAVPILPYLPVDY